MHVPLEACDLQVNNALLYHPKEAQNPFYRLFHELFPSGGMTWIRAAESLSIFMKRLKHISSIFIWPSNSSTLYSNSIP